MLTAAPADETLDEEVELLAASTADKAANERTIAENCIFDRYYKFIKIDQFMDREITNLLLSYHLVIEETTSFYSRIPTGNENFYWLGFCDFAFSA